MTEPPTQPEHLRGERRSQAERRATTRAQLLEAGLATLHEQGYDGVTLAEVARRAGLSNGALWRHFQTKAALMAEVSLLCGEHLLGSTPPMSRSLSPERRIGRAITYLWSLSEDASFQALIELIRAGRKDPELEAALQATDAQAGNVFYDTLAIAVGPDVASAPTFRRNARILGLALYGTALTAGLRTSTAEKRLLADLQGLATELFVTTELAQGATG